MSLPKTLPSPGGHDGNRPLHSPLLLPHEAPRVTCRTVYAAAPVVADPWRADATGTGAAIDWEATMAERRRLWRLGLGVAEAMDTAQRGMGLTWPDVQELVTRSLEAARDSAGEVVVGIAADQLLPGVHDVAAVTDAYLEQLAFVEGSGGSVVMMASRQLAAAARHPDDYVAVYDSVLSASRRPVVLHWLGEIFDPQLAGYWGRDEPEAAGEVVLDIIGRHQQSVTGIKMSLLDADWERWLRRRLPSGVRLFTGDDFAYVDLIAGDGGQHSDALLGAFAVVPRYAAAALARLEQGDEQGFRDLLEPTLPLSRLVFQAPTQFYKVGVVWLAYLDGRQDHFRMVGGLESGRSLAHLVSLFDAAEQIGYFDDPERALGRLTAVLRVHGL